MTLAWAGLVGLVVVVAGCANPGPNSSTSALKSGIDGTVQVGPACPVQRDPPDPSCADHPLQADFVVQTGDPAHEVARVSSDGNGNFRVSLAPGTYAVAPAPGGSIYPRCPPSDPVTVVADAYTKITITCDSGIR